MHPIGHPLEILEELRGQGVCRLPAMDALGDAEAGERHLAMLTVAEERRRVGNHLHRYWSSRSALLIHPRLAGREHTSAPYASTALGSRRAP